MSIVDTVLKNELRDMSIFGRPSHRPFLEPELAWATPQQRGFDSMREVEAQRQGGTKGKGKSKPSGDQNDERMRTLLDGLKRVSEDEKQADGVMVSGDSVHRSLPCLNIDVP